MGGGVHGKREKDGLEIVLRFGQVEDRERREGFRAGKKQRGKRDRWEMKGAAVRKKVGRRSKDNWYRETVKKNEVTQRGSGQGQTGVRGSERVGGVGETGH